MIFSLLALIGCSLIPSSPQEAETGSQEPLSSVNVKATPSDSPLDEDTNQSPIPTGGARLFVQDGGQITITTSSDHSSVLPITAGMLVTDNALTLANADGVFEVSLLRWDTGDSDLNIRLRESLFDATRNPLLYAQIHDVSPLSAALITDTSKEVTAVLTLTLPNDSVDIPITATVERTQTAYSIRTHPINLPYGLFVGRAGRTLLNDWCPDNAAQAAVTAVVDLALTWDTRKTSTRIPVVPPRTNAALTGVHKVKSRPTIKNKDTNRDFKAEPLPHDLRGGNVQWRLRDRKDDNNRPPPFEER